MFIIVKSVSHILSWFNNPWPITLGIFYTQIYICILLCFSYIHFNYTTLLSCTPSNSKSQLILTCLQKQNFLPNAPPPPPLIHLLLFCIIMWVRMTNSLTLTPWPDTGRDHPRRAPTPSRRPPGPAGREAGPVGAGSGPTQTARLPAGRSPYWRTAGTQEETNWTLTFLH